MSNVSVAEMLQRKTLPDKAVQLEILRQVAAQLDQAHQRNLSHGNLSPQSILVSELGPDGAISVFVKDFGTTFDIDPGAMNAPPPANAYYLSPEQVLGIDIGPQSDQFSFAVIAYEMLSGGLPFSAPKLSGLIFAICSDPPRPIYEFDPSLTAAVQNIFNRALAKDRDGRYASCWAFVTALLGEVDRFETLKPVEPMGEAIPIAAAASVAAAPPPPPVPEPPAAAVWNGTPVFEPTAAPPRAEFDLPPVRRRNRYEVEEDEPARGGSAVKRVAIFGVLLFALAGAGFYFFNGSRTPNLPTQVLDTKNAPVTPPPSSSESKPTTSTAPSTVSQPAPVAPPPSAQTPAVATTSPVQSAQAKPEPTVPAPTVPAPALPQPTKPARKAARSAVVAPAPSSPGLVDVELLSEPPGANVIVDGDPALTCKAPCNISLRDGRHTLSANLAGYTLAQRIFNVPETTSVFVTMPRLNGALVVTSNPSAATILVDGKDAGLTPATLHLPPGPHRVTLLNGSQRHDETVNVVADGIQATGYTFAR